MAKLILVRHGESTLNKENVYFGHLNPSLTSKGKEQLEILKNRLPTYDMIFSSPLERAISSAEIINHNKLIINTDDRLKELNFGIFEGLNYNKISSLYPVEVEKWLVSNISYKFINGESIYELSERVKSFVEEIKYTEKNYLLVTHFGVINAILSIYIAENLNNFWKFKCDLSSITLLEFNDGYPILKCFSLWYSK